MDDLMYKYASESLRQDNGLIPKYCMWEGVPLSRFTKDELMEIIARIGKMVNEANEMRT